METKSKNTTKSNISLNGSSASSKADLKNGIPPIANGMPISTAFDNKPLEAPKTGAPATLKDEAPSTPVVPAVETAKAEQPKPEASKAEIKEHLKEFKPAMNLEQMLKWVETMHRRKIHRDKLVETIDTLDNFEVAQMDGAEETGTNHFQGCELTIEDDKRNQFVTKNPFIIKAVADYVKVLCVDKLSEIEAEIVVPA